MGPLLRLGVAQLRVVLYYHLAGTHLLQGVQAQPEEVLGPQHQQTVTAGEGRLDMVIY